MIADYVLEPGAQFILWLQQFRGPLLDAVFEPLSILGGIGYLFLVPLVLWTLDGRLGLRLVLLMALSLYLNTLIKEWVALPRPFEVDPRIVSDGEHGYSFPSGHAQLVVVFWGLLALHYARRWLTVAAAAVIVLTGLSRSYLGVHYPSDVLAGWAIGGLTLWLWARGEDRFTRWWRSLSGRRRQAAVLAGAAGLAALAAPVAVSPMLYGCVGFAAGAALGAILVPPRARVGESPLRVTGRYLLGMPLTLLLIAALNAAAEALALPVPLTALLALALLGFWITAAAPALFGTLRLNRGGKPA